MMRGLIIRAPWIDLILDGRKTWEMRSKPTAVRGPIALIRQGSNTVVGTADLIESREPLSRDTYMSFRDRHAIPRSELDRVFDRNWIYPWVLSKVRQLPNAIPFNPKSGAVIFSFLDCATSRAISDQVGVEADSVPYEFARPERNSSPTRRPAVASVKPHLVQRAPSDTPIFTVRFENAQAFGRPDDGGFVVLANSTAMRNGTPNMKRDREDRDMLVRIGVLVPDTDTRLYRFIRDYRFSSSSKAAGIVKDGNASGPSLWKDEASGRTLLEHLAKH